MSLVPRDLTDSLGFHIGAVDVKVLTLTASRSTLALHPLMGVILRTISGCPPYEYCVKVDVSSKILTSTSTSFDVDSTNVKAVSPIKNVPMSAADYSMAHPSDIKEMHVFVLPSRPEIRRPGCIYEALQSDSCRIEGGSRQKLLIPQRIQIAG